MTLVVEAQAIPLKADKDGVIRVGDTRVTLETAEKIWREIESKPDYQLFRERLLTRSQATTTSSRK